MASLASGLVATASSALRRSTSARRAAHSSSRRSISSIASWIGLNRSVRRRACSTSSSTGLFVSDSLIYFLSLPAQRARPSSRLPPEERIEDEDINTEGRFRRLLRPLRDLGAVRGGERPEQRVRHVRPAEILDPRGHRDIALVLAILRSDLHGLAVGHHERGIRSPRATDVDARRPRAAVVLPGLRGPPEATDDVDLLDSLHACSTSTSRNPASPCAAHAFVTVARHTCASSR